MNSKLTFLTILLFGGLIFTSSCKKEDTPDEPIPTTINVKIDGTDWKTTKVVSGRAGSDFTFLATKGTETLLITIPEISVDTFLIDGTTSTAARYAIDLNDPIKTFYAGSGSIIIESIKGTQFQAIFNLNTKNAIGSKKIFTAGHMVNMEIP